MALRDPAKLENIKTAGEAQMSVYMVERDLAGFSLEQLSQAQRAAISKGDEMTRSGRPARYIRTTFAPDDGRCMCLFEAESSEDVRRLNEEAGLPFSRIVPALDLTP